MSICFTDVPLLKSRRNREAPLFARTWCGLLHDALVAQSVGSWFDFFVFPKCVLLTPVRGGRRISKVQTHADLVNGRISAWSVQKAQLWEEVLTRSGGQRATAASSAVADFEKRVVAALRLGDVRKALQAVCCRPNRPEDGCNLQCSTGS